MASLTLATLRLRFVRPRRVLFCKRRSIDLLIDRSNNLRPPTPVPPPPHALFVFVSLSLSCVCVCRVFGMSRFIYLFLVLSISRWVVLARCDERLRPWAVWLAAPLIRLATWGRYDMVAMCTCLLPGSPRGTTTTTVYSCILLIGSHGC